MSTRLHLLVVHTKTGALLGRSYPIDGTATIGRASDCTITIDEDGMSRMHARIEQRGETPWIVDRSSNGTFVGGARISEAPLADGDLVQLGVLALRVVTDGSLPSDENVYVPTATDGLTGALNRRTFMERTEAEHRRARAEDSPLSVVLFGHDRFGVVNATFGHPAGDEVLRAIADLAKEHVRPGEHLARYSGDELAWLLPKVNSAVAVSLADTLRAAIASHEVLVDGHPIVITSSVGVASRGHGTPSADSLVADAGRALRAAKLAGGNRVSAA